MSLRYLLIVVLALLLVASGCDGDEEAPTVTPPPTTTIQATATSQPGSPTRTATPSPATATATATATAGGNVCRPNPSTPAPGVMRVDDPRSGATARSPLRVTGRGVPIEGIFVVLYDAQGGVIARTQATVVAAGSPEPVPGGGESLPFTADITFSVASQQPACLWVHKVSGRDGSPINIVQVPLVLAP